MQIYLSSYMLGDHGDHLLRMVGGAGARMAVITNALDGFSLDSQLEHARMKFDPVTYFLDHGFDPTLIDLRRYFGRPHELERILGRFKVIWSLGGNSFLLRRAMRDSGFDQMLGNLLQSGVVYSGWSAGACVAGDDMAAVAIMDEPDAIALGYLTNDPIRQGLGLVPFTILPHYQSDHFEAPLAERAVNWAIKHGVEYVALRDGEVIVREGDSIEVLPKRAL